MKFSLPEWAGPRARPNRWCASARDDPVPFLTQRVHSDSPRLWDTPERRDLGGLVLHAGREHALIDIDRSRDTAGNRKGKETK